MIPLLALLLAASPPVRSMQVDYYDVTGSSTEELRDSLNHNGHVETDGQRYDGHTQWTVSWKYTWRRDPSGQCTMTSYEVVEDVRMILPKWQMPAGTSVNLSQRWNAYLQALRTHEDGHVRNGDDAAAAVGKMLADFGTRPTCDEIDAELKSRGKQVVQGFMDRDIAYDRETRHGETQGAEFP